MIYDPFYTEEFLQQVQKYRAYARQIERKIHLLLKNPYQNCKSERLHGRLKGLRSARLTRNIRIIFAICEEIGQNDIAGLPEICSQRSQAGENAVIFITLDVHEKAYRNRN